MSRTNSIVLDHGKIYVSEHFMSVCRRMGTSIQPAGTRERRDNGPLERFVRITWEGMLQYLPGLDINAPDLGTVTYVVDPHEGELSQALCKRSVLRAGAAR
jgi:transposase InsO family protein